MIIKEVKSDIYSAELLDKQHSLRYIHITCKNVIGILNRIANLMRRKRYNMEEVSVSFDNQNRAHILIAVDGRTIDIQQLIHLLQKIHDVFDAYDATHLRNQLFNAFYIHSKDKKIFDSFPISFVRVVKKEKGYIGIFMVTLDDTKKFIEYLRKKRCFYEHRLLSLI